LRLKVLEGTQAGSELGGSLPWYWAEKMPTSSSMPDGFQAPRSHPDHHGKLLLIDLHSTNGNTLNNETITQRELKQGDRIGIGQTVLLVSTSTFVNRPPHPASSPFPSPAVSRMTEILSRPPRPLAQATAPGRLLRVPGHPDQRSNLLIRHHANRPSEQSSRVSPSAVPVRPDPPVPFLPAR